MRIPNFGQGEERGGATGELAVEVEFLGDFAGMSLGGPWIRGALGVCNSPEMESEEVGQIFDAPDGLGWQGARFRGTDPIEDFDLSGEGIGIGLIEEVGADLEDLQVDGSVPELRVGGGIKGGGGAIGGVGAVQGGGLAEAAALDAGLEQFEEIGFPSEGGDFGEGGDSHAGIVSGGEGSHAVIVHPVFTEWIPTQAEGGMDGLGGALGVMPWVFLRQRGAGPFGLDPGEAGQWKPVFEEGFAAASELSGEDAQERVFYAHSSGTGVQELVSTGAIIAAPIIGCQESVWRGEPRIETDFTLVGRRNDSGADSGSGGSGIPCSGQKTGLFKGS